MTTDIKPIPDYPGYLISSSGDVVSSRRKDACTLSPKHDGRYLFVALRKDGRSVNKKIHRLVMETFYGPSELAVNHINGIKTDNRLENLEYCTSAENTEHAWNSGLCEKTRLSASVRNTGEKSHNAKLTDAQAAHLLSLKGTMRQKDVAIMFGVRDSLVSRIWSGKRRKHLQHGVI